MKKALIIFAKNPLAGKVKTRLAKDVGNDAALAVYRRLLGHIRSLLPGVNAEVFVFYADHISRNDLFDDTAYHKYVQCEGHIGERMRFAFSIPFKNDYKQVVLVGTDLPELSASIINQAFEALDDHDFVLGPAADGGYYLIGMNKWQKAVFEDISWSTSTVFAKTKQNIESLGSQYAILAQLRDLDTIDDLKAHGWDVES